MKYIFAHLILFFLSGTTVFAQVDKKIIVEHFTNSVCSICASRNPGFYENLSAQDNVLHLAVHPSAPYSSCLLNQNNTEENDDRTNYYSIYGSTPRLVIQGDVISAGADYSSAAIFTSYFDATSPVSMRIEQIKYSDDSIFSNIIIKTEAEHSLGDMKLFAALVEDTLFYSSPNGEDEHYDVFRKSLFETEGMLISLPATVGDSVMHSATAIFDDGWDEKRIYTLAILQENISKDVVQTEAHSVLSDTIIMDPDTTLLINNSPDKFPVKLYPNPVAENYITIEVSADAITELFIYDIYGQILFTTTFRNVYRLTTENFSQGDYFVRLKNASGQVNKHFIKL